MSNNDTGIAIFFIEHIFVGTDEKDLIAKPD
jgi:hypothetical protein